MLLITQPLPIHVRLLHGENPHSYALRLARHNLLTLSELQHHLHTVGVASRSWTDPQLLQALRALGNLHPTAFTEPRHAQGNWISARVLCLACSHGEPATGRRPDIGLFCRRHHQWMPGADHVLLPSPTRHSLPGTPAPAGVVAIGNGVTASIVHRAESRYRRWLFPRAEFFDAFAMRYALSLVHLLTPGTNQTSTHDRPEPMIMASLYARQVNVAVLLTRCTWLRPLADPRTPTSQREQAIRAIAATAAPNEPLECRTETWPVENRLWSLSADLQRLLRGQRLTRQIIHDPEHNLLRHLIWPR